MACRRVSDIVPWLVDFFLCDNPQVHGKSLHVMKYMSGPHEDGSIVKVATDLDISVNVRFTGKAIAAFNEIADSDSQDAHKEFNRAFIIVRKYWPAFCARADRVSSTFELVIDDFSLWMNETGLRLKLIPMPCMNVPELRSKANKLWAEWKSRQESRVECAGSELQSQAVEDSVFSMNSIPLSQLLDQMGVSSSSSSQPQQASSGVSNDSASDRTIETVQTKATKKVRGGIFKTIQDMSSLRPADLPMRLESDIDLKAIHISNDQSEALNQIAEWRLDYQPPPVSYVSSSHSAENSNESPSAQLPQTPPKSRLARPPLPMRPWRQSKGKETPKSQSEGNSSPGIVGRVTPVSDFSTSGEGGRLTNEERSRLTAQSAVNDKCIGTYGVDVAIQVGEPMVGRRMKDSMGTKKQLEMSMQVGNSLLEPDICESQSQYVSVSQCDFQSQCTFDTVINVTHASSSRASVETDAKEKDSLDDHLTDTQAQQIISLEDRGSEVNSVTGDDQVLVLKLNSESYASDNDTDSVLAADVGDYASEAKVSYSESPESVQPSPASPKLPKRAAKCDINLTCEDSHKLTPVQKIKSQTANSSVRRSPRYQKERDAPEEKHPFPDDSTSRKLTRAEKLSAEESVDKEVRKSPRHQKELPHEESSDESSLKLTPAQRVRSRETQESGRRSPRLRNMSSDDSLKLTPVQRVKEQNSNIHQRRSSPRHQKDISDLDCDTTLSSEANKTTPRHKKIFPVEAGACSSKGTPVNKNVQLPVVQCIMQKALAGDKLNRTPHQQKDELLSNYVDLTVSDSDSCLSDSVQITHVTHARDKLLPSQLVKLQCAHGCEGGQRRSPRYRKGKSTVCHLPCCNPGGKAEDTDSIVTQSELLNLTLPDSDDDVGDKGSVSSRHSSRLTVDMEDGHNKHVTDEGSAEQKKRCSSRHASEVKDMSQILSQTLEEASTQRRSPRAKTPASEQVTKSGDIIMPTPPNITRKLESTLKPSSKQTTPTRRPQKAAIALQDELSDTPLGRDISAVASSISAKAVRSPTKLARREVAGPASEDSDERSPEKPDMIVPVTPGADMEEIEGPSHSTQINPNAESQLPEFSQKISPVSTKSRTNSPLKVKRNPRINNRHDGGCKSALLSSSSSAITDNEGVASSPHQSASCETPGQSVSVSPPNVVLLSSPDSPPNPTSQSKHELCVDLGKGIPCVVVSRLDPEQFTKIPNGTFLCKDDVVAALPLLIQTSDSQEVVSDDNKMSDDSDSDVSFTIQDRVKLTPRKPSSRKKGSEVPAKKVVNTPKMSVRRARKQASDDGSPVVKRKRGHPVKDIATSSSDVSSEYGGSPVTPLVQKGVSTPRRRGRPPKEKPVISSPECFSPVSHSTENKPADGGSPNVRVEVIAVSSDSTSQDEQRLSPYSKRNRTPTFSSDFFYSNKKSKSPAVIALKLSPKGLITSPRKTSKMTVKKNVKTSRLKSRKNVVPAKKGASKKSSEDTTEDELNAFSQIQRKVQTRVKRKPVRQPKNSQQTAMEEKHVEDIERELQEEDEDKSPQVTKTPGKKRKALVENIEEDFHEEKEKLEENIFPAERTQLNKTPRKYEVKKKSLIRLKDKEKEELEDNVFDDDDSDFQPTLKKKRLQPTKTKSKPVLEDAPPVSSQESEEEDSDDDDDDDYLPSPQLFKNKNILKRKGTRKYQDRSQLSQSSKKQSAAQPKKAGSVLKKFNPHVGEGGKIEIIRENETSHDLKALFSASKKKSVSEGRSLGPRKRKLFSERTLLGEPLLEVPEVVEKPTRGDALRLKMASPLKPLLPKLSGKKNVYDVSDESSTNDSTVASLDGSSVTGSVSSKEPVSKTSSDAGASDSITTLEPSVELHDPEPAVELPSVEPFVEPPSVELPDVEASEKLPSSELPIVKPSGEPSPEPVVEPADLLSQPKTPTNSLPSHQPPPVHGATEGTEEDIAIVSSPKRKLIEEEECLNLALEEDDEEDDDDALPLAQPLKESTEKEKTSEEDETAKSSQDEMATEKYTQIEPKENTSEVEPKAMGENTSRLEADKDESQSKEPILNDGEVPSNRPVPNIATESSDLIAESSSREEFTQDKEPWLPPAALSPSKQRRLSLESPANSLTSYQPAAMGIRPAWRCARESIEEELTGPITETSENTGKTPVKSVAVKDQCEEPWLSPSAIVNKAQTTPRKRGPSLSPSSSSSSHQDSRTPNRSPVGSPKTPKLQMIISSLPEGENVISTTPTTPLTDMDMPENLISKVCEYFARDKFA